MFRKSLFTPLFALSASLLMVTSCQFYFEDNGIAPIDRRPMEPGAECTPNPDNCMQGCYCADDGNGNFYCEETGFCNVDEDCVNDQECDIDRGTCVPATPTPTCDQDPAVCGEGEVCDTEGDAPVCRPATCEDHQDVDTCSADTTCTPVFTGINCTDPNGADCTEGSADCSCESFVFASCILTEQG